MPPGGIVPDAPGAPWGCCEAVMPGATPLVVGRAEPEDPALPGCGPDISDEVVGRTRITTAIWMGTKAY